MTAVVFCGPTIDAGAVRAILPDAGCRPPAAMGDIYRAGLDRPAVIALIDGVFLDRPAVWHREVLAVLEAGIPIWGAASMGALRAVECETFGMVGTGKIVEAYRTGRYPPFVEAFEDDDEVAVLHGPAELGSPPLSDAMVDLRETLARAAEAGTLSETKRDDLAARMKALHFGDRSFARLTESATEGLAEPEAAVLAEALASHKASQKRADAEAMLRAIAARMPDAPEIGWVRERTAEWERFVATTEVSPPTAGELAVLDALAEDPAAERAVTRRAAARLTALDAAGADGDPASTLGDFRRDRGLYSRTSLDAWLSDNALSQDGLAQLLAEEAALDALAKRAVPDRLRQMMLDELRLSGHYQTLSDQAGGAR